MRLLRQLSAAEYFTASTSASNFRYKDSMCRPMEKAFHCEMTTVPLMSHAGDESWFHGSRLATNGDLEAVAIAPC